MNAKSNNGGYVIALVAAVLFGCMGKTIATLRYKSVGTTEQAPLAIAPNAKVGMAVHADKYSYSGANGVMLDGELLKGGQVVAKVTCEGFDLEGGAGSGCGATHYSSSCSLTAPAGGADTVRVATRMQNRNTASFEGLEVRVLQ